MEKFKYLAKNKISQLPKTPGVYAFLRGQEFLYIGKAVNLRNRVRQHKLDSVEFSKLDRVEFIETASENDALLLELKLIKKYRPKYNTQWKDDKNYFYVGITKEPFPRVFITHQPNRVSSMLYLVSGIKKNEKRNTEYKIPDTKYIGPFVDGKKLKQALKDLRKIHPYRTCKILPKKPCLWHHLKQCPAPCFFTGQRLEAYDISNIQGTEATGSMVAFINGKPDKNFYRKFKIKTVSGPNDVAMIGEVLSRRLKHKEWPYPDIILIDGGKAQFNVACLTLKVEQACSTFNVKQAKPIKVMALAKKDNKLYIEGRKNPVLLESLPQEFANLILRARDEAHRFARAYHHHLRKKSLFE